jgi:competence protein ComEA
MNPRTLVFPLLLALSGLARAGIDVNTASLEDLQKVRGIGPATAARIVAARAPGPFRDAEDLQERVRGFGPTRVRKLVAAGLSVPSVRIPAAPPPRGPEIIAGNPPAQARASGPVCTAPLKAVPRGAVMNSVAPQRKPKATGPA